MLSKPWPWYIAGPLIGLTVPLLLLLGNKPFGLSSNLRHLCAALVPTRLSFFRYDWKAERWNLAFVAGMVLSGTFLSMLPTEAVVVQPALVHELAGYGITPQSALLPHELFSWSSATTLRGFLILVVGGFLVGFGTRYAGGCTSGHAINGLSTLQWPSLVATLAFMAGGILSANVLLPYLLRL
ncbi:MAG: YeeE/YedE family protein [Cyclobacteriaceae bacterium]|jgi:hypothetical protein|nr:YeeE/YedE family protein [Cyclobacteriaceae bacterium]